MGKFDAWLAENDGNARKQAAEPAEGRFRAGIGVYYFEEKIEAEVGA